MVSGFCAAAKLAFRYPVSNSKMCHKCNKSATFPVTATVLAGIDELCVYFISHSAVQRVFVSEKCLISCM
jgi:hypothetical protein